jgi:RimJ/RimL family protein N-acetyltransferase
MVDVIVETARLVLRRWEPGDLDLWLDHLNTPQVTDHLGGVRTRDAVIEKFDKLTRGWDEDGFSFLAVALKADGRFLGTCGIARIANASAPEALKGQIQIGWQLRADMWGKGYATEAARAALGLAFGRCGFETLYAQTAERNRASWAVMEKLGMRRRKDMDYADPDYPPADNPTIIYALERADWTAAPEEKTA